MAELDLEISIQDYRTQICQIESAILITDDENTREDLRKLKSDLGQLIKLSEESLLSLKKKQLLEELDDSTTLSKLNRENIDHVLKHRQDQQGTSSSFIEAETNETTSEAQETLEDSLAALEGTKCRAPFSQSWGQYSYHNALILSVEPCNDIESSDDIKVRVLFCNPINQSMRPCPYFLEGNCNFSEERCRFSHGHIASLDELKEFQFPDYELLQVNAKCLAQHTDGIWYPAIVNSIDDHEYDVQFDQYGNNATLAIEQIIPLGSKSDSTSSDSDVDDSDKINHDINSSSFIPNNAWNCNDSKFGALGQWEQYTKGIGSKLMAKMGYIVGQGLGKHGEGRINPVEATVLPVGKSLDKCMELRNKQQSQDPIRRMKRLRRNQLRQEAKVAAGYYQPQTSVFDFLNKKLTPGTNKLKSTTAQNPALKSESLKDLNIKSIQLGEEISKVEKQLDKVKVAIQRNAGNKSMQLQLQEKLRVTEDHLGNLRKREMVIRKEQTMRKENKKLTIF